MCFGLVVMNLSCEKNGQPHGTIIAAWITADAQAEKLKCSEKIHPAALQKLLLNLKKTVPDTSVWSCLR